MELRYYLEILRRRWVFIAVTVVAALAAAWLITPRTPLYTAESRVYVGARQFDLEANSRDLSLERISAIDRLLVTFSAMIDSRVMADAAREALALEVPAEFIVDQTSVAPVTGTQLLAIKVTDEDPALARDLADQLADSFVENIVELEGGAVTDDESESGTLPSGLPANVFETAELPTAPNPTNLIRNLLLAAVFGLLAAAGTILLIEYLDITVKSGEDVEHRMELPVLGVIPRGREITVNGERPMVADIVAVGARG